MKNMLLCLAVWLPLSGIRAFADIDPAVANALHAAHTVYLVEDPHDGGIEWKSFVDFFKAFQAMGRFQLVPTVQQADFILRCTIIDNGTGYSVTALDPQSLVPIATFSSQKGFLPIERNRKKGMAAIIQQIRALAGSAGPPAPAFGMLAVPVYPGPDSALTIRDTLHRAKTVFLEPDSNGKALERLRSALQTWTEYRIVQTLKEANLVLQLRNKDLSYCRAEGPDPNPIVAGSPSQICLDVIADYRLQLLALDAKTLLPIAITDLPTKKYPSENQELSYDSLVIQLAALGELTH